MSERHSRAATTRTALMGGAGVIALSLGAALDPLAAETLGQALTSSYTYSPQIDAQRARLRATDEGVAIAQSGYRPTINANGTVGYQSTFSQSRNSGGTSINPNTGLPVSTSGSGINQGDSAPKTFQITLNQPIFRGFQTLNAVNAAEANVRAGRETLRDVERTVLLQAATAYNDVVRDQVLIQLQESNVQVLTRELKATQDRFSVGEVTRTDVAQSEAARAGSVSLLETARANLKTSRASFEQVIGHAPSALAEPRAPEKLLPRSLDAAIEIAAKENPLVVAALYNEQAARYSVEQIRGQLLPQVSLQAQFQNNFDSSPTSIETRTGLVEGVVTVPIYEGGQIYAQVRQAKHTHISLLQTVELTRTQVQQAVTAAWAQLSAARAQLESDQTQAKSNAVALNGVREEERVGQRTLLDVLNAQQALLNSRVSVATDKRNVIVAAYTLLSQIGHLDAIDISVHADIYDPEDHYLDVRRKWFGVDITHADGHREHLTVQDRGDQHRPAK